MSLCIPLYYVQWKYFEFEYFEFDSPCLIYNIAGCWYNHWMVLLTGVMSVDLVPSDNTSPQNSFGILIRLCRCDVSSPCSGRMKNRCVPDEMNFKRIKSIATKTWQDIECIPLFHNLTLNNGCVLYSQFDYGNKMKHNCFHNHLKRNG